ncbi:50S ribosomal protein L6 [Candidatus Woesearchaeota archaeon]|nr:50S ribosomal protein L6 [Candidatus Woesearchaeota archaeon]
MKLPDSVNAAYENGVLSLKGPNGENKKSFAAGKTVIKVEGDSAIITYDKGSKRSKKEAQTIKAHIKNMARGVTEGHTYKLKICSGHFPMSVSITGNELAVKNFIGEKHPRTARIAPGVKASVEGQEILVRSASKEAAAQCAASIEQLTKRADFDRRVFMDGIFIINKDGKELK